MSNLGNTLHILIEVVVTSTDIPESITLSCMLMYMKIYGNHHTINRVHERVRPLLSNHQKLKNDTILYHNNNVAS